MQCYYYDVLTSPKNLVFLTAKHSMMGTVQAQREKWKLMHA